MPHVFSFVVFGGNVKKSFINFPKDGFTFLRTHGPVGFFNNFFLFPDFS